MKDILPFGIYHLFDSQDYGLRVLWNVWKKSPVHDNFDAIAAHLHYILPDEYWSKA